MYLDIYVGTVRYRNECLENVFELTYGVQTQRFFNFTGYLRLTYRTLVIIRGLKGLWSRNQIE